MCGRNEKEARGVKEDDGEMLLSDIIRSLSVSLNILTDQLISYDLYFYKTCSCV